MPFWRSQVNSNPVAFGSGFFNAHFVFQLSFYSPLDNNRSARDFRRPFPVMEVNGASLDPAPFSLGSVDGFLQLSHAPLLLQVLPLLRLELLLLAF